MYVLIVLPVGVIKHNNRPQFFVFKTFSRGVVLRKKWGTPETRLRQRFVNNLGLIHAVLKLSYTAFQ